MSTPSCKPIMSQSHWMTCVALASALAMAACGASTDPRPAPQQNSAVVTLAWRARPDSMRVLVRDTGTIRAINRYLATGTGGSILSGRIARGAGVDARVPFHYLPDSAALVEVAIELCDSRLLRTPAEVDAYFQGATGRADAVSAQYCPWDARPVSVAAGP